MPEKINLKVLVINARVGVGVFDEPITKIDWDNLKSYSSVEEHAICVKSDMDANQLKGYVRDCGWISSQQTAYKNSKLYFAECFGKEAIEIASGSEDDSKSLTELGARDGSLLFVAVAQEERPRRYYGYGGMRCLYGCPMSEEVMDAVAAEGYKPEVDSEFTHEPI